MSSKPEIEELRSALEHYNQQNNNELSPFHAARDNLLKALAAAVLAQAEK